VPVITDFGLAKRVDSVGGPTQSGAILGTPSYMPPEQARGDKGLTTGADTYALGAILYELLTGQPPFRGATPLDTVLAVLEREPVRPRSLNLRVDRDLETVCLKCLEKDPAQRYSSAETLAEDLERWLAGEPISARPVGKTERLWRWCRRNPVVAGLSAALLLVLLTVSIGASIAAVRFRDIAESERAARDETETARQQAQDAADVSRRRLVRRYVTQGNQHLEQGDLLTALPWLVEALALEDREESNAEIHRIRVGAILRQCPRLTRTFLVDGSVRSATLSPDGRRLFTVHQGQDTFAGQVWDVGSGQVVCRLDSSGYGTTNPPQFSADGRRLVGLGDAGPSIWDATTGKRLTSVRRIDDDFWHAVQLSPDGQRLLTIRKRFIQLGGNENYYGRGEVRVWNATDGTALWPAIRPPGCSVEQAQFSPDGSAIVTAAAADGLEGVKSEPGVRLWNSPTGKPIGPLLLGDASLQDVPFSPDGRLLLTVGDKKVYLWDTQTGKQVGRSLDHEVKVLKALFHPGGERVLTLAADGYVRLWDAGKGELIVFLLRLGDPDNQVLRLSPDGLHLLVHSTNGNMQLWDLFRRDGNLAGPCTPPWPASQRASDPPFTPDGRHLLTFSPSRVLMWDLAIGSYWVEEGGGSPWWQPSSPDGRFKLRADNQEGRTFTVRVHDAKTGATLTPPQKYAGAPQEVRFSPDSQQFLIRSNWPAANQQGEQGDLRLFDSASGRVLHTWTLGGPMEHTLSPDLRRLVTFPNRNHKRPKPAEITIRELESGRTIRLPQSYEAGVGPVFSPDSRKLALFVYGRDKEALVCQKVELWDLASGEPGWEAPWLILDGGSAVFSPDSSRLGLGGHRSGFGRQPEPVYQVWDVGTGQPVGPLLQGSDFAEVRFLPDGRRLLVQSGSPRQVRVWDAVTGKPVTPPWTVAGFNALSSDGRLFASGVAPLRLWDVTTGELIASVAARVNLNAVCAFGLSPDARQATADESNGTRVVYPLGLDERPLSQLRLLASVLSGHRIDHTGAYVALEPDEFRSAWRELQARYPESSTLPPRELQAWERRQALRHREAEELLKAKP
jgi:eukaryotic-like serine/threonine-protein kinase